MPLLIIPNVFINGTVADADLVNQNYNATANVVNALDYQNIGALGIFASDVRPTTEAQATFGGSVGYRFLAYDQNSVPLTIRGNPTQAAHVWRVVNGTDAQKVWIDKDYVLHADATAFTNMDATKLTLTGDLTAENVYANNDVIAIHEVRSNANIRALGTVDAAHGQFARLTGRAGRPNTVWVRRWKSKQHSDSVSMAGGAHYDGTKWVADAVNASVIQTSSTPEGARFFADDKLTSGGDIAAITMRALIDIAGLAIMGHSRIRLPFSFCSIGTFPTGMYLGHGFHYDHDRAAFVSESALCVGILMGSLPAALGNSRFSVTYQTGIAVGATFTPVLVLSLSRRRCNGTASTACRCVRLQILRRAPRFLAATGFRQVRPARMAITISATRAVRPRRISITRPAAIGCKSCLRLASILDRSRCRDEAERVSPTARTCGAVVAATAGLQSNPVPSCSRFLRRREICGAGAA